MEWAGMLGHSPLAPEKYDEKPFMTGSRLAWGAHAPQFRSLYSFAAFA